MKKKINKIIIKKVSEAMEVPTKPSTNPTKSDRQIQRGFDIATKWKEEWKAILKQRDVYLENMGTLPKATLYIDKTK